MAHSLPPRGGCSSCQRCGSFLAAQSTRQAVSYPPRIPFWESRPTGHLHADFVWRFLAIQASESSFENSFRSLCVCNEPWFHHEALRNASAANPLPPAPAPPALRVPPPLNPLHASLPTPISTFTGPLSGSGTANENRNTAIARHFPKPKKYKAPHAFPLTRAWGPLLRLAIRVPSSRFAA
ncbi:hypothetical protein C8F04DRAFT_1183460 [Mycena alexandri]|uniref:Uncharacterized protein n=1 Tax=Mycena alexandri TaxID=1745969 RepID=A0AAD6SU80_9AGAR|nr:hypothetical protein C8F04DRAFT_1183460 [Mycena alexandri]